MSEKEVKIVGGTPWPKEQVKILDAKTPQEPTHVEVHQRDSHVISEKQGDTEVRLHTQPAMKLEEDE
jgi:hypothetical protein